LFYILCYVALNDMARTFKFIKTTKNGVTINTNTCMIQDILESGGKTKVFIIDHWRETTLTEKEIHKIHNAI